MFYRVLIASWFGIVCGLSIDAQSQTLVPTKAFGRYQQFVWQDQHGLPQNTVRSVLRTRDGYLWLGTLEGAVRFDGVRFTVFDSGNTKAIGVGLILAMLEDRAGNLWLATDGAGVVRRAPDGTFTRCSTQEGLSNAHVTCLLEDRASVLWVGTDGGGLNRFEGGRFTRQQGVPSDQIWALAEDAQGGLWAGTMAGLTTLRDGRIRSMTERDGLPHGGVRSLSPDQKGELWIGTDGGLSRLADGRFANYGPHDGLPHGRIPALMPDREGTLWIGTRDHGVFRLRDGQVTSHSTRDGLPGNAVDSLYQDPEGNVWIGTDGSGVAQLRDGRMRAFSVNDGVPDNNVRAVIEDTAGALWIGTARGLARFRAGAFQSYTAADGLPSDYIRGTGMDREGHLWLATNAGATRFENGRFSTWTTAQGLSSNNLFAVLGDRAGNVWLATFGGGLNRLRDGTVKVFTTRDGLADNELSTLFEDRAGSLWIGTRSGGVSRFTNGGFTTWSTSNGLPSNHILSFFEDRSGAMWIGTHGGGLTRLKDGKLAIITTAQGLYDNLAFQILEDDQGDLWMSANKGLYRVSLNELNAVADGKASMVTSFVYGVADGMLSRECNGGSPAGWKTRDGRLWFATVKGVVAIDPKRRARQPPLVAIEQVTVDRQVQPTASHIRISPGQDNLEIAYTGLSWARPQYIAFKYRLAGLDPDWVDAGSRRTAYFSHLPPGDYTFTVIADNGEGVWNTEGKSLRILVLPPYYRTGWFLTLTALGMIAILSAGYHYRIGQLTRARVVQQTFSRQLIASQEGERKRIAAELHDSLGQRLIIIKNMALLFLNAPESTREARQQIEEISTEASQAIGEVKEIAYNLRPYQLDRIGLTKAVEAIVRSASAASTIAFSVEIDDIDDVFPKDSEINFYRIVQESLNNILKHSSAANASITIRRDQAHLSLTIHDDGKGWTLHGPQPDGHPGGFGLVGISERAQLLGGTPRIQSAPGQGTTISMEVALRDGRHVV
jgi:ligand-binding sensor domain-containing protein/signal transduction histidine kinase